MADCTLDGYVTAVAIEESRSKAVIQRCKLLDCTHAALFCQLNPNVSMSDSEISGRYVIVMFVNVTGKVVFRRNVVRSVFTGSLFKEIGPMFSEVFGFNPSKETAVFSVDRRSKEVDHDFEPVHIEYNELGIPWCHASLGATKETRTNFFDERSWVKQFFPDSVTQDSASNYTKKCKYCNAKEGPDPKKKFKYCQKCRKVCYCSRECQLSHWTDHKLVCAE